MRRKTSWQTLLALLLVPAVSLLIQIGAAPARTTAGHAKLGAGTHAPAAEFRTVELAWQDRSRRRKVPALLFWPTDPGPAARTLIVFSHGLGSARDGYSYLGRYWARHGIASLHVQHVGSDRSLWEGNPVGLAARFSRAANEEEAIARVHDVRFALDRLLVSEYGPHIDLQRIVAAGHSYGANTTLLLAGARVERAGRVLDLRERRIAAAILISAPPFHGEAEMGPILSAIRIPSLHITTTDDIIVVPGFESGPADRRRVFEATGGFKVMAVYKHGSHNVFTERRYFDSVPITTEVKAATESLSLAFLDEVFGQRQSLRDWARANPVLLADYVMRR